MDTRKVSLWFDKQGDLLEIVWEAKIGHFVKTADARVVAKVDAEGNVIGFNVLAVSTLDKPVSLIMPDKLATNRHIVAQGNQ